MLGAMLIPSGDELIREINELIHANIDNTWMAEEWRAAESGKPAQKVHPLVSVALIAHRQIQALVGSGASGITPEIWELGELAIKVNFLKKIQTKGIDKRLARLCSSNFGEYRSTKYEIQIAGMFAQRGHEVAFIDECESKTPDILISNGSQHCEVECKNKDPLEDQVDYINGIYNNTQRARKQFSKTCPGLILIEIDTRKFDEFQTERQRLSEESSRAMRNSSSISGIFLTSKIAYEDTDAYGYQHRIAGSISNNARDLVPQWLLENFINVE